MAWFTDFYRAAVGKKAVMAVTGIILFGFILVHMIGNLHLYEGPGHLDEYGTFLRQVGAPQTNLFGANPRLGGAGIITKRVPVDYTRLVTTDVCALTGASSGRVTSSLIANTLS